jgi:anti-sigma B factor antagonist
MSTPSAQLFVFVSGHLACVKIVGRANFATSIDFKALVSELEKKGFSCYILDLAECVLMDSTFLGVLSGMALKTMEPRNGNGNGNGHDTTIELLNPNARNLESLESLGVLHLFRVVNGTNRLPAELAMHALTPTDKPTREEVTRNCLEAHKILMEICPTNIPKFKEVTQFLAEDLKKLKPDG